MGDFDIVIRNGRVIDGTGGSWFRGDICIRDERIVRVERQGRFQGDKILDAEDRLVCPGFIDVHTHSDITFLANPKADSKIKQGVTTEIVGNCGSSAAPVTEHGKRFLSKRYEDLGVKWDWETVTGYLGKIEAKGPLLNVGTLIGQGTIRASVMGFENREPSGQELDSMKDLVADGMRDGAFGLSTGLKYAPGCYAKTDEIVELCTVVREFGGIYSTHIRNQGDFLIESIDEALEIGRRSGIPVHIAHLKVKGRNNWGKAGNMLRIIDESRSNGFDVTFDQYPYRAGSTGAFAITPDWAREGGVHRFLERLRDREQRKHIEAGILEQEDWRGSEKIVVALYTPDSFYEGKSITDIGKLLNKAPESVMCDLLLEADGLIPMIIFYGWERDVREIMVHNAMMVGSDGYSLASQGKLGRGKPHPRSYGCFPRFLGRYVLGGGIMSVEEGIRRMTSFPAARFGLKDRGLLRENMFADIAILDPKLMDTATYDNPHQYPRGMDYVLVNGVITVEDGELTGESAGKTLRHSIND